MSVVHEYQAGVVTQELHNVTNWNFLPGIPRSTLRGGGGASRREQPEPSPPLCPALTSEADSQLVCVGRKQELFPFYFIFMTNSVPRT